LDTGDNSVIVVLLSIFASPFSLACFLLGLLFFVFLLQCQSPVTLLWIEVFMKEVRPIRVV
jgi:hypothetical protein